MTKQVLARRDGKLFCKKRVMRKACIPLTISEETISLLEKFVVNVQRATMKYEIIRKPMVLQRVEINLLKSAHYY